MKTLRKVSTKVSSMNRKPMMQPLMKILSRITFNLKLILRTVLTVNRMGWCPTALITSSSRSKSELNSVTSLVSVVLLKSLVNGRNSNISWNGRKVTYGCLRKLLLQTKPIFATNTYFLTVLWKWKTGREGWIVSQTWNCYPWIKIAFSHINETK